MTKESSEISEKVSQGMPSAKRLLALAPAILVAGLIQVAGQDGKPGIVQQGPDALEVPRETLSVPFDGVRGLQGGILPDHGDHGADGFGQAVGDGADAPGMRIAPAEAEVGAAVGQSDGQADDPAEERGNGCAEDHSSHFSDLQVLGYILFGAFFASVGFVGGSVVIWPLLLGRS